MKTLGIITDNSNVKICEMYSSLAKARSNHINNHHHVDFEISLILSGSGIYKTQKGNIDIKKGDLFIFSTNEPHCITDIYTDEMHILNLHFQPVFIWNENNYFVTNNYLKVFFDRNSNFSNRLDRSNTNINKITELFLEIQNEFLQKNEDYITLIRSMLLKILILINRNFNITNNSTKMYNTQQLNSISFAIKFIEKNYTSQITLEEIAKAAMISKSHFCVIFKKINGLTPWEYINIKRINFSLHLLKTTDYTILEIATRCGYNNTANFNKIFKSITGTTPKNYRHM